MRPSGEHITIPAGQAVPDATSCGGNSLFAMARSPIRTRETYECSARQAQTDRQQSCLAPRETRSKHIANRTGRRKSNKKLGPIKNIARFYTGESAACERDGLFPGGGAGSEMSSLAWSTLRRTLNAPAPRCRLGICASCKFRARRLAEKSRALLSCTIVILSNMHRQSAAGSKTQKERRTRWKRSLMIQSSAASY